MHESAHIAVMHEEGHCSIDPHRNLWAAVLQQAIEDVAKKNGKSGTAREWFESSRDGVGSFLWVCGVLDFDPEQIGKKLGIEARQDPFQLYIVKPKIKGDTGMSEQKTTTPADLPAKQTCRICGEPKDWKEFFRNPTYKSGYETKCKQCYKDEKEDGKLKKLIKGNKQQPGPLIETQDSPAILAQVTIRTGRASALAEQHWNYISQLLAVHDEDEKTIERIKFHYCSAFEHGFKHGSVECVS
jgi:hypothetical protein